MSILLHWKALGITWEREIILDLDGWPSLQCQTWKESLVDRVELRLFKALLRAAQEIGVGATELESMDCCRR